jgi:L-aminopeptidase/D-esterase-like protein
VTATADWSALGLRVGHYTDSAGATGVSVVRGDGPFRAAAAVLGRATGTRELDALSPHHLVDRVDAIVLSGGSAYGLGSADGVMKWMEERGRGYDVRVGVVPIVPTAVIFDLGPLGKTSARPTARMAYEACERAEWMFEEGSVGAGTGATVGKGAGIERAMKGGLGAHVERSGAVVVGALAVVNALGDVRDSAGRIIAGARADGGGFADVAALIAQGAAGHPRAPAGNTTLCVVATNAALSRLELAQVARASEAALSRRITPVGTTYDGDVIFAVGAIEGPAAPAMQIEALAVRALEIAIERAVRLAKGRDGVPGLGD